MALSKLLKSLCFASIVAVLGFSVSTHAKVIHQERSVYTRIIVEDTFSTRCLKFTQKRDDSTQTCININNPKKWCSLTPKCP